MMIITIFYNNKKNQKRLIYCIKKILISITNCPKRRLKISHIFFQHPTTFKLGFKPTRSISLVFLVRYCLIERSIGSELVKKTYFIQNYKQKQEQIFDYFFLNK
jgi:hypothetical protein